MPALAQGVNDVGNVRGRVAIVLSTSDAFGGQAASIQIALAGSDRFGELAEFTESGAFVTEPLPANTRLRIAMPGASTDSHIDHIFGYITA